MRCRTVLVVGFAGVGAALSACGNPNQGAPAQAGIPSGSVVITRSVQPDSVAVTRRDVEMGRRFHDGIAHVMPLESLQNSVRRESESVGYPLDVSLGTGPLMASSKAYNVYVNCKDESCWGHPEEFLEGLPSIDLTTIITQYTGSAASSYQYAASVSVKYRHPYSNTYYNEDLYSILAAAVRHFGSTGLQTEYHLFLPKGVDTCFDQTKSCYAPDDLRHFEFCAYHDYVALKSQAILYSVEPFQDVYVRIHGREYPACHVPTSASGVNELDSATGSTLGHESFESWSDPEPNTGWYNSLYGDEIADACSYYFMALHEIGSEEYYIQDIYSNAVHGCSDGGP
jgi:hypothetical protein